MNKENLYTENCIRTVSGIYVNIFDLKEEMICIEDIAHALAHQCRFGGHLPEFFSVAQHSYHCSLFAAQENKLAALLHDASEAYLMDIPRPIKSHLTNYKDLEDNVMKVIAKKFSFQYPLEKNIKEVDNAMLVSEWHQLMIKDCPMDIICYPPAQAKEVFLQRFNDLTSKK